MSDSVALLGWDEQPIRVVQDTRWKLRDRADSTNKLTVTTSLAEADGVDAEQELIFKERGFTISGVERDRAADRAVITANEHQAALAGVELVGFRPNSWSLTRAMEEVLSGTLWTLGEVEGIRYGRADFDEIKALDALHFLARHQDAKLSFDSLRRRVNITPDHGTAHEYVFTYGRQLSNIEKDVQQPVTTVIYPTMAEDVVLDPVEDYGYYLSQGISLAEAKARFRKEEYWDDSRYEIEENMTRDAQKRLEEEAYPRVTYVLTAQATVDVEGADDFDLSELRLGDTVYVWDQDIDTKLSAEVTAVTTSSDQSQNELTLSTLPASLGDSVSGRGYFGDSGKPSSGGPRRSGPQPKPSMPILEQVSDYGTAVTRWNGQDSEGNFNTIPQRFGTLLTLVAPLTDGVIPSPNDSSQTFMGSDITKRGGGLSNIGFNDYGEFAVWHQMRGWDGMTLSEFSEPLVVDVPPAWDPQPTVDKLDELNDVRLPGLRDDLDSADDRLTQGQNQLETNLGELGQRQDALEVDLTEAEQKAEADLSDLDTTLRGAFSTQLDTVLDALSAAGRTWSQDSPPPAGTTYEWVGTAHESESLERMGGVAGSRNLITNPSFETGTHGVTSNRSYGAEISTFGPAIAVGQQAIYVEFPDGETSTAGIYQSVTIDQGDWGRWLSLSLVARMSSGDFTNALRLLCEIRSGGSSQSYTTLDTSTLNSDSNSDQERRAGAILIPDSTDEVRMWIRPQNGVTGSMLIHTDAWAANIADTEAEALDQAESYFDGDSLDDRQNDLWINSNGTQHRWDNATKEWVVFTNEQLQESVDEALSKADAALTQAGTKNTVYYGTTEDPGFDGVVAGDQYRHTDNSDDVISRRRWNGAQWVRESITSEVIDNLDVGKLTAGSVTTPEAVIEKLMADGITANVATLARVIVSAQNTIPDPDFEDMGWWRITSGSPTVIPEYTHSSGTRSRVMRTQGSGDEFRTQPFKAVPGDSYVLEFDSIRSGSASSHTYQVFVGGFDDSGSWVTTIGERLYDYADTSWGSTRLEFTVPDNPDIRTFEVIWRADEVSLLTLYTANPVLKSALDGRMIVNGLLQASSADLQELFFDTAVGNAVWADAVRSRLVESQDIITENMVATDAIKSRQLDVEEIFFDTAVGNTIAAGTGEFLELNADQIRSNSWTGIVATGATFQTHADANRGVKMTPAGLRGWDGDGDLSFRFNGTNNYLRGSLHAGTSSNSEIHLDYRAKFRMSGVTDEGDPANEWTIYTPSIDFHSGHTYQANQEPSIFIDDDVSGAGQMAINPGYLPNTPVFRSRINVLGDIVANRTAARERFQIETSRSDQPGVIQHVGQGVRIRGQVPSLTHSQEMFYTGQTDQASLAPGGLRKRTISWGLPVPRGRRDPIVTVYMADVPSGNNAYVVANVSNRFTNSYRLDEYNPSTAHANYWVGLIAPWRDV